MRNSVIIAAVLLAAGLNAQDVAGDYVEDRSNKVYGGY
jgi:hypothetical protein